MKKVLTVFLAMIMILSCAVVAVSAATEFPADEDDACRNGEAGIEIPYKAEAPTIDGVVEKGEYIQLPNDVLCSYYSIYLGENQGDWTVQEKYEYLHDVYMQNEMNVYANWDGKYLYFALTATAPLAEYTCPKAADSVNMFRYWCLQCGCAEIDTDPINRFEIGLGAPSDTDAMDHCYYFNAWGQRIFKSFKEGTDYFAHWDYENELVTYEVRFNIKEIIGHMPQENDQMRFLYLLSQSGQLTQDAADNVQIQSAYGCAMEKNTNQYLLLTFVGVPEDVTVDPSEQETEVEEEELEGYWGKTDFRDHDVVEMITNVKALTIEEMKDDNGDKYIRMTATGDEPYCGGPKLPIGLNSDSAKYMAFRYRTSSPEAKWLGISYQSMSLKEQSEEYLVGNYDDLICDGQWHTVVLDLYDAPSLSAFMTDLLIWPFADANGSVKGCSMDLMWIKYYTEEPFFEDEPVSVVVTDAPVEPTAEPATTAEDPTAGADTAPVTDAETDAEKSGCSSVIDAAMLLAVIPAAFVCLKKKKH